MEPTAPEPMSQETLTDERPLDDPLPADCVEYADGSELRAAVSHAKEQIPEVDTAYSPSGKVPLAGLVVFLPGAALVTALVGAVCVAACFGVSWVDAAAQDTSLSDSRKFAVLMGLVLIVFDLLLFIAIAGGPGLGIGWLCRPARIRSLWLPLVTAFASGLLIANVLFLPWFGDVSFAPINISFVVIPLKWPLRIIGMLAGVIGAPVVAAMCVSKQKYCEEGHVYLKPAGTVWLCFDIAPEALVMLAEQRFDDVLSMPRVLGADKASRKHSAELTVWSHERAATGFVEMTMRFRGMKAGKGKAKPTEETEKWLAFSNEVDARVANKFGAKIGILPPV